jgi:flagellar basal-body rod protein FlgF
MNEIMSITLQGMRADAARVEQIAMNIANTLTPGYKRGVAVQAPVAVSFAAHLSGAAAAGEGPADAAPIALAFVSDPRPGTLKSTGQPLDVAISGGGFFEVITEQGPAYTRQGNFRLDASGRLVTTQGYLVMGQAGEIVLSNPNPVITATGAILASAGMDDAPMGQLKVVTFEGGPPSERLGEGLLAAGEGMKVLLSGEVQVRQGFLENSNVASTLEMTALIQAMRHFESMHKVAQGHDDMLGTAIRKLGETS